MDVNALYSSGGNFLKASDVLQAGAMVLTIRSSKTQQMKDGKAKLELAFMETDRTLLLNKTNAMIIAAGYGGDSDTWTGKKIKLTPGKTTYEGKLVDCINVATPRAAPAVAAPPARDAFEDDIPF